MRRDAAGRLLSLAFTARNIQRLLMAEVTTHTRLPFRRTLWGWRHGFTTYSNAGYRLSAENVHEFVSDYARYVKTPRINGPFLPMLNNKLAFSRLVASHGGPTPEYYCFIGDHGPIAIGDRYRMRDADGIAAACMTGSRFIVKPCTGGGGVRVSLISSRDGRLTLNHREVTEAEFARFINSLSDAVVCEFIQQHEYAARIFPDSANSIRVLTMWDYERNETFIPFAGHRFGGPKSVPVDNVSQGGVAAQVDVASGKLLMAHSLSEPAGSSTFKVHPHTGVAITGTVVPNWEMVKRGLLKLSRKMSYIPYIGWDIIVTEDGFRVIEGNNHPHLGHQEFEPLLRNPRVRAFYERFGAL